MIFINKSLDARQQANAIAELEAHTGYAPHPGHVQQEAAYRRMAQNEDQAGVEEQSRALLKEQTGQDIKVGIWDGAPAIGSKGDTWV